MKIISSVNGRMHEFHYNLKKKLKEFQNTIILTFINKCTLWKYTWKVIVIWIVAYFFGFLFIVYKVKLFLLRIFLHIYLFSDILCKLFYSLNYLIKDFSIFPFFFILFYFWFTYNKTIFWNNIFICINLTLLKSILNLKCQDKFF